MENPYRSPQSGDTSGIVAKPSQVTVFGILHIFAALAGFGLIIFNKLYHRNPKATILEPFQQNEEAPASFTPEALSALDKALSFNIYFEVISAILATMLLTSGLAMLLNARWGINLSNKYCLLSIVAKIITIILSAAIIMPAYRTFCDGISGGEEHLVSASCITFQILVIAGPVSSLLYPVIVLIFLTRPRVKEFQKSL